MSAGLYHYTDGNGLLGILTTRKLWLTHIAYLNDSSEYSYSKELLKQIFKAMAVDNSYELRAHAELSTQRWAQPIGEIPALRRDRYVASFSEREDDLSQWRGYSTQGARYCIQFSKEHLCELASMNELKFEPVTYAEEEVHARVRNMYGDVLAAEASRTGASPNAVSGIYAPKYFYHNVSEKILDLLGPWLKHYKFAAELEWRLAATGREAVFAAKKVDEQILYRIGKSFLIPYVTVALDPARRPIQGIWVGPSAHPEHSIHSLQSLVHSQGWGGTHLDKQISEQSIMIRKSDVPYRDW